MQTQDLTIEEFAELLKLEAQRGIIDGDFYLACIMEGVLPKVFHDFREEIRLRIERVTNGIQVTQYQTELSKEMMGEIN